MQNIYHFPARLHYFSLPTLLGVLLPLCLGLAFMVEWHMAPQQINAATEQRVLSYQSFSCNDVSEIPQTDCNALVALYQATSGPNWTERQDWLATKTPCSWYGVTCAGNRVSRLELDANNLKGTLPTALGNLSELTWLEVQFNQLSGPIPAELGNLLKVTELSLYKNQLTGTIPTTLGNLKALKALRLGFNQLTGSVPPQLGALRELTILGIDSNQLTGSLPTELGDLTKLELFNADKNQLTGTIPSSFSNFPNMWRLWLEENQFSGALPATLGNLTALKNFSVRDNGLRGPLPTSLTNLTQLSKLDLGYNGFSTTDSTLRSFLDSYDPDWATSQTVPPTNVQATVLSGGSALVTWTPIAYIEHGGYYEISYSTIPGGPYTVLGQTADKTAASYTAMGLSVGTTYYFVVRTHTPLHDTQRTAHTSDYSAEAMAITSSFTCSEVTEIPSTECNALIILYNSTSGTKWINHQGWLETTTPCSWFGIQCSGGHVSALELRFNGLRGALPGEVASLTKLTVLKLDNNAIGGSIPPQIGDLGALTFLDLSNNEISGNLPETLGNLKALLELRFNKNQISGIIPPALGDLTALTHINLANNQLTGSIPSQLGNLKNLQVIFLSRNQLNGPIPSTFGQLVNLVDLRVPENRLRDEIPTSLAQLSKLTTIRLAYNRLYSNDQTLTNFLNRLDPTWFDTQTVPPTNVKATAQSANTIQLTWTPIRYQENDGHYEVRYATQSGGPYEVHGVTKDKTVNGYEATGLLGGVRYYFVVRTITPPFGTQVNGQWGNTYSNEATAMTPANTSSTPPSIISAAKTTALRGQEYLYSVIANGGTPMSFALAQKPIGMSIDTSTGLINWTPNSTGSFPVTVRVTNAFGNIEQSFIVTVQQLPEITSEPVTTVAPNQPYAYDVDATGVPAPTYQLTQAPTGMTIDSTSGLIQWTPTNLAIVNVTVRAQNSVGEIEQEFTINVATIESPEQPEFTSEPVTIAAVGDPYSYNVDATGKPSPQFSLTTAPTGMTINATTGVINWVPTTAGATNVTVVATNSAGTVNQSFTVQVATAVSGDDYENDDTCNSAQPLDVTGATQTHTFHDSNDIDWVKFSGEAGKTYIITVDNIGARAKTVVGFFDACATPPVTQQNNAFGSAVRVEWDATRNGDYYLQLQHNDATFAGDDTEYNISVLEDNVPPSTPKSPRCSAVNASTLAIQWQANPERDVRGYRIPFAGAVSGSEDVDGKETTFYELGNLSAGQQTRFRVVAVDYSGNESPPSGEVSCVAATGSDGVSPTVALQQPANSTTYTTAASQLTFRGLAQDSTGNLSRVRVRNTTTGVEKTDFGLAGASAEFRVEDIGLAIGINTIVVTAIDGEDNEGTFTMTIERLGESSGAVLIIAGRNETASLQTNIHNATNRAYRIFKSAGYSDDDIYYIAGTAQRPDGDEDRVDAIADPDAVREAITNWAQSRVGPERPFTLYLMDHGLADRYCVTSCGEGGHVTPAELNDWLRALETATGVTQVNIIIEACQSGSFLDRQKGNAQDIANSLSRQGRVVITSTGRINNAYASAEGAFFSDSFFSCVADSGNLQACFTEAEAAVATAGVDQTPWMDDNGDGLYNAADGAVAEQRFITRFFSSVRPVITDVQLERNGVNGTLIATVADGAEAVELVWANVYPPSFTEPTDVTLNLQAPTVRLEADPNTPGRYTFNYVNGFTEAESETEQYRVVFYAQDRKGIQAKPIAEGEEEVIEESQSVIYLPIISGE